MDGFKEFQGKSLDEAIRSACSYFDSSREKLEIEIIQDAKSGIFGLVGARKALVKARRVQLDTTLQNILKAAPEQDETPVKPAKAPRGKSLTDTPREKAPRKPAPASPAADDEDAAPAAPAASAAPRAPRAQQKGGQHRERPPRKSRSEATSGAPRANADENIHDELNDGAPCIPFDELDQEQLITVSQEVIARLITAIVDPLSLTVELGDGHINARIDCGDDSGLLIGREGQTLAALQYMASRLVSRRMGTIVRVQLDAGEYRLRQDEKLRDMALALAEKVRATGRSFSTRPLSSYHRRIVHMMLQDAPDIQTRSSGDGPLKRVVVQRKRP